TTDALSRASTEELLLELRCRILRPGDRRRERWDDWEDSLEAQGNWAQRGTYMSTVDVAEVGMPPLCRPPTAQDTTLGQFANQLLHEKRIIGGPARRWFVPAHQPMGPGRAS